MEEKKIQGFEQAVRVLPLRLRQEAMALPAEQRARVEELRALGLAAPDTVELLYELRSRGIDIPLDEDGKRAEPLDITMAELEFVNRHHEEYKELRRRAREQEGR